MFGLSFAEMAVIMVMALVVIGPKELPAVIRAVARTFRQVRELGGEFRRNLDELTEEAELKDLKDDINKELTAMPTLIDLEGNEQRTYDISEDLEQDSKKRPAKKTDSEEGA